MECKKMCAADIRDNIVFIHFHSYMFLEPNCILKKTHTVFTYFTP